MKASVAFTLLITAVAAMLWLPNLFTYGMFMDGVINASVAKLYAEGTGTFFHLQERYYENGAYVGHPPLAFVMQGWFFKIFGTAYYMDKLYSMLCAVAQLMLIGCAWRSVVADKKLKLYAWLPCLLWLISPIISWGYSSNLLENSMSLFTTAAFIAILQYVRKGKAMFAWAAVAALLVLAAVLCKGPVGLFVLAAPVLLAEVNDRYTVKTALAFSLITITGLGILLGGMLLLPGAQQLAIAYIKTQLSPAVSSEGALILNRLQLIPNLLKALLPILIVAVVVLIGKRWLPYKDDRQERVLGIRLILLGLCATLPIMVSNKQSAFYVIPAMPVFALAFALLIVAPVRMLCERFITSKARVAIAALSAVGIIVMGALSYHNAGTAIRDKEMLHDLAEVNKRMKDEVILWDANNDYSQEYHFKAYLSRLYGKEVYYNRPSSWRILKEPKLMFCTKEYEYKGSMVNLYFELTLFEEIREEEKQ